MSEPAALPTAPKPPKRPIGGLVFSLLLAVGFLGALGWVALTFKLYTVPQKGMYPSIAAGDKVVGRRRAYESASEVQRGDVVVFSEKKDGKPYDFIWRVIGLPGEEIAMVDDVVIVDGKRFERQRLREEGPIAIFSERIGDKSWTVALPEPATDRKKANMPPRKLGDGEFFLLGDNRHDAYDSRETGPVPYAKIAAKIVYP